MPWQDVDVLVESASTILANLDIRHSPVAAASLISLFRVLVESGGGRNKQPREGMGLGGGSYVDTNDGQLAHAVLRNTLAQKLVPAALAKIYVAVDMIEGLDVDKEDFDKHRVKDDAAKLFERIWSVAVYRSSIVGLSSSQEFREFVMGFLEHTAFVYGATFESLRTVRESAKTVATEGFETEPTERKAAVRQTMDQAKLYATHRLHATTTHLVFLSSLASDAAMCKSLCKSAVASKLAAFLAKVMSACTGEDADELTTTDVRTLDVPGLLIQVVLICANIVKQSAADRRTFLTELGTDLDYSPTAVGRTHDVVAKRRSIFVSKSNLELFASIPTLVTAQEASSRSSSAAGGGGSVTPGVVTLVGGYGDGGCGGVAVATTPSPSSSSFSSAMVMSPGSPAVAVSLAQLEIDSHRAPAEVNLAAFEAEMSPFRFAHVSFTTGGDGDGDGVGGGDYNHAFAALIRESSGSPEKTKRLMKEIRAFQRGKTELPLHPGASIFLAADEDRMDVCRAVITGPVDSPYAFGCFVFDIFFPDKYPQVPPLIKLITTGAGTVRFNPNLYNDGKVCLSLLGTWHGGDASEKWDPNRSTLYQVLVSIQSIIMVEEPIYNEPGVGGQGTPDGDRKSKLYNDVVVRGTVRFAMLEMLRKPVAGFEEMIPKYFKAVQPALVKELKKWIAGAEPEDRAALTKAADRLSTALVHL